MRWPWQKRAAPSVDPAPLAKASTPASIGFGGFSPSVPVPPATVPAGADGVPIFGGFIVSGERDPRLAGHQKWITYSNAELNVAIIASAINVWTQLAGSAKWTTEPNPRGGRDAQLGADIVNEGLFEAQTSTPWRQVVRRQSLKKFRGFAMHEVVLRRRPSDDLIVVADIQDRPQWTIWRWNRPDLRAAWVGVEQQLQLGGQAYYIPRERLFYSVENTLSASPEGVGVLRQLAECVRVLELYKTWEGIGFQTDLRGVPIARAPLSTLLQSQAGKPELEARAFVQSQVKFLTDFLGAHNKRSDQGILLDSAPFFNKDAAQSPSGAMQWGFDLVKAGSTSMPEVNTAIMREVHDIARVMCAEWLLLGGEDSGGAYSMHEDKTAMFGLLVNAVNDDIADDARRDIATRLIALNGLDPETCTPRLVPEPVASGAVKDACTALQALAAAALAPNDPARNVLRARLNLPPEPEVLPDMYGAMPPGVDADGDGVPDDEEAPAGDGEAGNPNADAGAGDAPAKEAA